MNRKHYLLWIANCLLLFLAQTSFGQTVSNNLVVSSQTTPSLNVCSGQGTFVVRLSNITAAAINNVTLKDSLPPGIQYVSGSVAGTGVSLGATLASNVVTFNVVSVPANGFVDISFAASANCSVSTNASTIANTYGASWGSFVTTPVSTPSYPLNFPSLSVNVTNNANYAGACNATFVRTIVITNGGAGPIDTLNITDVNGSGIALNNMTPGVFTSTSASSGKLLLTAAQFATVGNNNGSLDQNESITLYDTVTFAGISNFSGTITGNWGCSGNTCTNGTTNNVFNTNASVVATTPTLTRQLFVDSAPDSVGFFNRTVLLREVVKNTGTSIAYAVKVYPQVSGTRYFDTSGLRMRYNQGALTRPAYTTYRDQAYAVSGIVLAPNPMPHADQPVAATVELGTIQPGDSVTVYYTIKRDAVTRVTGTGYTPVLAFMAFYTGGTWLTKDGLATGPAADMRLYWEGCAAGSFNDGAGPKSFPELYYNGSNATPITYGAAGYLGSRPLSKFMDFTMVDSSDLNNTRCSYYDGDTARLMLSAGTTSIPYYNNKSKLFIRLKLDPGLKWDGNIAAVKGYINTSANPWIPGNIVDNIATDSTIDVYFSRANCPNSNFGATNTYVNAFRLSINLINTCAGSASSTKNIRMFRYYDVDTSISYPILAGADSLYAGTMNSTCSQACTNGISILNYSNLRTTYDRPDNDNDGVADAGGTIDMTKAATTTITWGDTMDLKMRMVVHTTQGGGVPYLYLNSDLSNVTDGTYGTTLNGYLVKSAPAITIRTAGGAVHTGTGVAPTATGNTFLNNLSLQGTGGIAIPGYTSFHNGDTVDLVQHIVYYSKAGLGLASGAIPITIKNTPYTALVANPTPAQRQICDTNVCNFYVYGMTQYVIHGGANSGSPCTDSTVNAFNVGVDGDVTASPTATNCSAPSPFNYELRNIAYPTMVKMRIAASTGFSLTSVAVNWTYRQPGSCAANTLSLGTLATSEYTFANDTMTIDLRALLLARGYNIDTYNRINMGQYFRVMMSLKKNSVTSCQLDHENQAGAIQGVVYIATTRPTENWIPVTGNPYTNNSTIRLGSAQAINNFTTTIINPVVTATSQSLPVNINITTATSNNANLDNHWIGARLKPGQIIDSVIDLGTGTALATAAGSNVYQIGALTANQIKNYRVYLRITSCNSDSVWFFADRTPCAGYPANVNAGTCLQYADSVKFSYVTFAGELQLASSISSSQKDICVADTLLMQVSNSQSPTAKTVKLNMQVPDGITFVPGSAQMKKGNGAWTSATDPVAGAGNLYTWQLPATDSLPGSGNPPNNSLQYQVTFMTNCAYISGSQIGTKVEGMVACGPITSLFNTNPSPLNINGATSSYVANVRASADTISGCDAAGTGYAFHVAVPFTGTPGALTAATDSIMVKLPAAYKFTAYSSATAGSHHSPAGQPAIQTAGDGSSSISFPVTAGIAMGDSVVFTFRYNERSTAINKCAADPAQATGVNVYSAKSLFCAATGTTCSGVKVSIGSDTVMLMSHKPSLMADVISGTFNQTRCAPAPCNHPDTLSMSGTIANNGAAVFPASSTMYMEVFLDKDSSGTLTAGDLQLKTYTASGGLGIGQAINFTYTDTVSTGCTACADKPVLIRFSNNPAGGSQCLCDSVSTQTIALVQNIVLPVKFGPAAVRLENCNARVSFETYSEDVGTSFQIERSSDSKTWNEIGVLQGRGNPYSGSGYSILDRSPLSGDSYYRIKIINGDGSAAFSKVLTLNNNCTFKGDIQVYPNPALNELNITSSAYDLSVMSVKLFNQLGQEMESKAIHTQSRIQLNISTLLSGVYILKVMDNDRPVHVQPVTISR